MMGCPHRQDSKVEEEEAREAETCEEREVQQFATAVPAFSSQYGGYKPCSSSYKVSENFNEIQGLALSGPQVARHFYVKLRQIW